MEQNQQNKRHLKIAGQIQKDMAEIIREKGMGFFGGALVSVSGVEMSPDLSLAKIYVSVFPSDKADSVMKTLSDNVKSFRGTLGKRLASQFRLIPEVAFFRETTLDYVEHIEELLKK